LVRRPRARQGQSFFRGSPSFFYALSIITRAWTPGRFGQYPFGELHGPNHIGKRLKTRIMWWRSELTRTPACLAHSSPSCLVHAQVLGHGNPLFLLRNRSSSTSRLPTAFVHALLRVLNILRSPPIVSVHALNHPDSSAVHRNFVNIKRVTPDASNACWGPFTPRILHPRFFHFIDAKILCGLRAAHSLARGASFRPRFGFRPWS